MHPLDLGDAGGLDHVGERPVDALRRLDEGITGLAWNPVDDLLVQGLMPVPGELFDKGKQGSGVALPEGMGLPQRGHRLPKGESRAPFGQIAGGEPPERGKSQLGLGLDVGGRGVLHAMTAKRDLRLPQVDGPGLSGPFVDVADQAAVDRLIMGQVELPERRLPPHLQKRPARKVLLTLSQRSGITEAGPVP